MVVIDELINNKKDLSGKLGSILNLNSDKLEKKLNTIVLSSNQALIWYTLVKIKKNNSVEGFGKLFQAN